MNQPPQVNHFKQSKAHDCNFLFKLTKTSEVRRNYQLRAAKNPHFL